jgi:hypothetical protein
MAGHNGYGATRGGRLPKPVAMPCPCLPPGFIKFAHQVKQLSVELNIPIMNVIEMARLEGNLECDDDQAFAIADFADKLKR